MKDEIKIFIATHKKYSMPKNEIYIPLHVGKEGKEDLGYIGDNTGYNISSKNANYCELTGLYWIYKNVKCKYVGLMHYRRYLIQEKDVNQKLDDIVLNRDEIVSLFNKYDVILPIKSGSVQKSTYEAYKKMHHIEDLIKVKEIINIKYPDYIEAFDTVMNGNELCLYNMFIMKKEDLDRYCQWLFDILFELEKRVDISSYSNYQKRIYGFLSERLFNVWLEKNKSLKKCYLSVYETEPPTKWQLYKVYFKNRFGIKD